MFGDEFGESINRRCLNEALSVQDMLSPAPARTSPHIATRMHLATAHLDRIVRGLTALVRHPRFVALGKANPAR